MSENKKKKGSSSPLLTLAILVCVGVMAFSGYKLVTTLLAYKQSADEYEALRQYTMAMEEAEKEKAEEEKHEGPELEIKEVTSLDAEEIPVEERDDQHTEMKPPITVDWDALKAINEDIIGWIYIETLDISYPVVEGEDNDYYLHRTFQRTDNFAGSIFTEFRNSRDLSDPNTIVYGHNMQDGSMFGMLAHLNKEENYKTDPWFWILTPEGNYRYKIFSMRKAEVEDSTYTLFNGTDQKFLDWCEEMAAASQVELDKPEFYLKCKIATLSTCTTDSGHRFVVQGIAIPEEK